MTELIKQGIDRGHVMRHEDSPTWCVNCGTFDIYCGYSACTAAPTGEFDSGKPEVFKRMFNDLFGLPPAAGIPEEADAGVAARKSEESSSEEESD